MTHPQAPSALERDELLQMAHAMVDNCMEQKGESPHISYFLDYLDSAFRLGQRSALAQTPPQASAPVTPQSGQLDGHARVAAGDVNAIPPGRAEPPSEPSVDERRRLWIPARRVERAIREGVAEVRASWKKMAPDDVEFIEVRELK